MTYDHFSDILGVIVMIAITTFGIFAIVEGNSFSSMVIGIVWTICGSGVLVIAGFDMWRRYGKDCKEKN